MPILHYGFQRLFDTSCARWDCRNTPALEQDFPLFQWKIRRWIEAIFVLRWMWVLTMLEDGVPGVNSQ